MKQSLRISALAIAAVMAAGTAAAAEPAGKTRAQVQAELAEAKRTGDILADGDTSLRMNEVSPHLYPAKAQPAGKSRAQVQAELAQAKKDGSYARLQADFRNGASK